MTTSRGRRFPAWAALLAATLLCASRAGADATGSPPPFDPEKARLAAQVRDPEAATRAYLEAVPAERRARTKAYALGNYVLDVTDLAFSSLVLAALLAFGVSAGMRDRARRVTRFRPLQTAGFWAQFLVVTTALGFPLTFYRAYWREKAYGLLTQGLGDWLLDQAKGLGVGLVMGSLLLMALYGILRRTPRTWWLWGAGVMIAFVILSVAIAPVFIEPLFNTFTPVADPGIRQRVLAMARVHGIPADEVYQMDASRRTDRIGAYATGMLGTTRIVVFDTTLRRCTPEEVAMIMAHEMGHYALDHLWKGVGAFAVLILPGFLFVRWGFARTAARWPRMRVEGVADVAGFPLLWLLLSAVLIVAVPLTNTLSRTFEAQADDFGLEASHEYDAAATTFLKLGEYRDLDPPALVEWLFYDHPSGRNRIRNAMEWKARSYAPPRRSESEPPGAWRASTRATNR